MGAVCYNSRVVGRRGQAALEYVLSLAGLLVVVAVMWGLVEASRKQSDRTMKLVVSEYP